MANFRTHITFGAVLSGVAVVFVLISFSLASFWSYFWIVGAVLVGSFLPDLDSDEGMPFQLLFGSFSLICGGAVFFFLHQGGEREWLRLIGFSVATLLLVRFGVGYLFKKLTHHRGMFHSIPASLIAGLGLFLLLERIGSEKEIALVSGLAVGLGYLGHLMLDEIWATVDFRGLRLKPSQSLGSALKFFSRSKIGNWLTWLLLAFLVFLIFF